MKKQKGSYQTPKERVTFWEEALRKANGYLNDAIDEQFKSVHERHVSTCEHKLREAKAAYAETIGK